MKTGKSIFPALLILLPVYIQAQDNSYITLEVRPGSGQSVEIEWRMKTERDSLPFVIQRSRNSVIWEEVARVPVDPSHHYISQDNLTGEGRIYYRLVRNQAGGPEIYSDVKWVQIGKNGELCIWPNPARDILYVKTTFNEGTITVLDASGKLLQKLPVTAFVTNITTNQYPPGIYFLHIRHGNETKVEKFIRE